MAVSIPKELFIVHVHLPNACLRARYAGSQKFFVILFVEKSRELVAGTASDDTVKRLEAINSGNALMNSSGGIYMLFLNSSGPLATAKSATTPSSER